MRILRPTTLVLWLILLVTAPAPAIGQDPEAPPAPAVPNLAALNADSWDYFETDPESVETRISEFLAQVQAEVPGLALQNQEVAQAVMESTRDNLEVYATLLDDGDVVTPQVSEPAESYTLDELLALGARSRESSTLAGAEELEVEREQRILAGASQRRDSLFKDYLAAEDGDDRWLTGLRLIRARAAQEISERRLELLSSRLAALQEQARLDRDRLEYAAERLVSNTDLAGLAELVAEVDAKKAAVGAAEGRLQKAEVDASSLDLGSASETRFGQGLLQQRQLNAEVRLAAAEVVLAKAEATRWWTELQLDSDVELSLIEDRALAWSEQRRTTESRLTDWQRAAEDELIALQSISRDGLSRQVRRLLDQSLGVTQDTLVAIGDLEAALDDLDLLSAVVDDAIATKSGTFRSWLATTKRGFASIWLRVTEAAEARLFKVGETPVTFGDILQAIAILLAALFLSRGVRFVIERFAPERSVGTTASLYTISRLTHYTIIILAAFIALSSIGLDLSNLALVAGALSVGIGFGLQSIVNNFVSGLIILFERSLRVGDYIELDTGLTGTVKAINVRSTLINTNDNIDIVVPNSEFVSTRLTNWTLGERILRVRIPFGVAYGSDKELVRKAAIEAAREVPYTLTHMPDREPDVWLVEYGDNSLNFLLLVWVNRLGARRPTRTRAAYLWELETKLKEYGIEIPFPQRDLHLRSGWPAGELQARRAEEAPADR